MTATAPTDESVESEFRLEAISDADDLETLLGFYLTKIADILGIEIEDDIEGGFPADHVLWQLIEDELNDLAELGPEPGYWHCTIMNVTEFTIAAPLVTMTQAPQKQSQRSRTWLENSRRHSKSACSMLKRIQKQ